MNTRQIIFGLAIAACFLIALACSVSPADSKTAEKIEFVAEKTTIEMGSCVNIFWEVESGANVKLNNETIQQTGSRYVCPDAATTYVLSADFGDDTELRKITIQVNEKAAAPPAQSQAKPSLDFWADRTTISKGECTMLHWRATGGGVWIGEKGYPPESEMQVCPGETKSYSAEIGDQLVVKSLVITVQAGGAQAPAAQPQQPSTNNQNNQSNSSPNAAFAVTSVKLSFEPGANSGVIATITTNAAGKVGWGWYWKGHVACHGELEFSAASTKTASCPVSGGNGGTMEFYLWQPNQKLYGSVNLPLAITDLAVTDIFPDNLPRGNVFTRITNRGPDSGNGQDIHLNCTALLSPLPGVIAPADPISVDFILNKISLSKGQTKEFDTRIDVDTDSFSYTFTCSIEGGSGDPNPSNNQYGEAMP